MPLASGPDFLQQFAANHLQHERTLAVHFAAGFFFAVLKRSSNIESFPYLDFYLNVMEYILPVCLFFKKRNLVIVILCHIGLLRCNSLQKVRTSDAAILPGPSDSRGTIDQ